MHLLRRQASGVFPFDPGLVKCWERRRSVLFDCVVDDWDDQELVDDRYRRGALDGVLGENSTQVAAAFIALVGLLDNLDMTYAEDPPTAILDGLMANSFAPCS